MTPSLWRAAGPFAVGMDLGSDTIRVRPAWSGHVPVEGVRCGGPMERMALARELAAALGVPASDVRSLADGTLDVVRCDGERYPTRVALVVETMWREATGKMRRRR